jgi:hypothetical protein
MKLTTALLFSSMILFSKASAEPLKVGDQAPVVSALTDTGTTLNLGFRMWKFGRIFKRNAVRILILICFM